MYSLLHLQRYCKISLLKNCTSVVYIKSFHSISNEIRLLKSDVPLSTPVRTFWECFPHIRPLFYEKDGLSRSKYELIYRAKIFNYAFYSQLVALFSLACQLFGGIYYAYSSYIAQEVIHVATHIGPFPINYDLKSVLIIGVFTIQNCLLLIAAQNAVLRAYYCEETDKFTIVMLAWNPFKSKLYRCNPGELVPFKENMFNIVFGNHKLNDKNMFIRSDLFKSTYYYNKIIGDNFYKML